jgi:hypothetical protein
VVVVVIGSVGGGGVVGGGGAVVVGGTVVAGGAVVTGAIVLVTSGGVTRSTVSVCAVPAVVSGVVPVVVELVVSGIHWIAYLPRSKSFQTGLVVGSLKSCGGE